MAAYGNHASIEAVDTLEGKRAAARYFWRWELPRTAAQFDLLTSLDRTVLDTPADVL